MSVLALGHCHSSRCGLAAMQRGHRHRLRHRRYCCSSLFLGRLGLHPRRRAPGLDDAAHEAPSQLKCDGHWHATQRARSKIFNLCPSKTQIAMSSHPIRLGPGTRAGPTPCYSLGVHVPGLSESLVQHHGSTLPQYNDDS